MDKFTKSCSGYSVSPNVYLCNNQEFVALSCEKKPIKPIQLRETFNHGLRRLPNRVSGTAAAMGPAAN